MSDKKISGPALYYLVSLSLLIICRSINPEFNQAASIYSALIQQNPTAKANRLLLNGRIWHNQYPKTFGDQYLLSNTFLKGSVIFNGRKYNNLDLKYDIFNDELILSIESYPVIFMNKEMVDSFSLVFENRSYHIINSGTDSSSILRGYVNVLYDGPSALYVKYIKKIQPLAVDGRYDLFVIENHIYLRTGAEIVAVRGKRKLFKLLEDKRQEIRYYMKRSKLKITTKDPVTLIPLLEFYDSIGN